MKDWEQLSLFPDEDLAEQNPLMTLDEMREYEWYVSWSGGKDSTATIILMHEYNIPIKRITYIRMMYDNNTPATLPVMTDFVDRATEVLRGWGYDVQIIPSNMTAKYLAERPYKKVLKKENEKRIGYAGGIARFIRGACEFTKVKMTTIKGTQEKDAYSMIGYASDETKRIHRLGGKNQSILVTLGITEDMAKEICDKNGLLSPLYGLHSIGRDGCWFCPNCTKRERESPFREA